MTITGARRPEDTPLPYVATLVARFGVSRRRTGRGKTSPRPTVVNHLRSSPRPARRSHLGGACDDDEAASIIRVRRQPAASRSPVGHAPDLICTRSLGSGAADPNRRSGCSRGAYEVSQNAQCSGPPRVPSNAGSRSTAYGTAFSQAPLSALAVSGQPMDARGQIEMATDSQALRGLMRLFGAL